MGEKIAMGFHACVDYELEWNPRIIEKLIAEFNIQTDELNKDIKLCSERDVLIACLAYFKDGMGGEIIPETSKICENFANHFTYKITIGGTAARAAIALAKIGYSSAIQICCNNRYIQQLMPKSIKVFSSVGEKHNNIYPHVVLQCPPKAHIQSNGIDFVIPNENRVMISRDNDSLQMQISADFSPMICDSEVFLLSSFSEILDKNILQKRMKSTSQLLRNLPSQAKVIMEDGCYVRDEFRYYVHQELSSVVDVLSMNEDELQSYIGEKIDVLDVMAVYNAIKYVHSHVGIGTIVVHSSRWVLAYGMLNKQMDRALKCGVCLSATRFRVGDKFGLKEYYDTFKIKDSEDGQVFCNDIQKLACDKICAVPCKDLSYVENPTVVGLGDFFAGGLLLGFSEEKNN